MFQAEHGWIAAVPWLLPASARWFGLLLLAPGMDRSLGSLRTRGAAAVLLALVSLPALPAASRGDGAGPMLGDWLLLGLTELAVGAALGTGMRLVFAGLRVAGELVDHQAGLALSRTFDPAGDEPLTPSGQALSWAVIGAFLLSSPAGGDVQIVACMLDLFVAIPPGAGMDAQPADLLVVLAQRSLDLAVRVAAPVLSLMSLVHVAFAFFTRSPGSRSFASLESPLRLTLCLAVLALSLSPVAGLAADGMRLLLEAVPRQLLRSESP